MASIPSASPPVASVERPATKGGDQVSKRNHAYNVASIWEKAAALDEDQLRVIEDLNASCSQRPIPAHVRFHDTLMFGLHCFAMLNSSIHIGSADRRR